MGWAYAKLRVVILDGCRTSNWLKFKKVDWGICGQVMQEKLLESVSAKGHRLQICQSSTVNTFERLEIDLASMKFVA